MYRTILQVWLNSSNKKRWWRPVWRKGRGDGLSELILSPRGEMRLWINALDGGERISSDKPSPRPFLHTGHHQRFLLLEFSHTCIMVRYIILRKHLLLIPPIIVFRNKSESAWFLKREGHLRHLKQTPRLTPYQPPPTAQTEEDKRETFSDFENGVANSTIIQNCDTVHIGHAIRLKKLKLVPVIPACLSANYCPKT